MNEFKERNKVESTLYEEVKKRVEEDERGDVKRKPKKVELSEREKEINEIINGIFSFFNGVLTEEEKQKLLEIDESKIPDTMLYIIYYMTKQYLKTGEITPETFAKCMQVKEREVEFGKIDAKLKKDPSEWKKIDEESDSHDGR